RRRLQEIEQSEDVGDEDEYGEGGDDGEVALAAVADDVVQQTFQPADDHLQEVLQRTGIVAADPARAGNAEDGADEQHQQGHDDVIGHVESERVPPDVAVERFVQKGAFVFHFGYSGAPRMSVYAASPMIPTTMIENPNNTLTTLNRAMTMVTESAAASSA